MQGYGAVHEKLYIATDEDMTVSLTDQTITEGSGTSPTVDRRTYRGAGMTVVITNTYYDAALDNFSIHIFYPKLGIAETFYTYSDMLTGIP
jgi:hypothetical protein